MIWIKLPSDDYQTVKLISSAIKVSYFSEKMLLPLAVVLVSCSCVISSDIDLDTFVSDESHNVLKRAAEKAEGQEASLSADPPKTNNKTHFFEIREDTTKEIVARLQLSQGAFMVNLVKTKNVTGVTKFEMDGRRVKSYGTYTFNKTEPTISATKVVKTTKDDGNSTKVVCKDISLFKCDNQTIFALCFV